MYMAGDGHAEELALAKMLAENAKVGEVLHSRYEVVKLQLELWMRWSG
jgi:hypothetical protein